MIELPNGEHRYERMDVVHIAGQEWQVNAAEPGGDYSWSYEIECVSTDGEYWTTTLEVPTNYNTTTGEYLGDM